jgi:hypothetical protein
METAGLREFASSFAMMHCPLWDSRFVVCYVRLQ